MMMMMMMMMTAHVGVFLGSHVVHLSLGCCAGGDPSAGGGVPAAEGGGRAVHAAAE